MTADRQHVPLPRLQNAPLTDRLRVSAPRRSPAQPQRKKPPSRTTDSTRVPRYESSLRTIVGELATHTEGLLHSTYGAMEPSTDLMAHIQAIRKLSAEAEAVACARGRARDEDLDDLAQHAGLGPDRIVKNYSYAAIDRLLSGRTRTLRPAPQPSLAARLPADEHQLRQPHQRLAALMSRLQRMSGLTQRQIAEALGIDATYVSRLLSGARKPRWEVVVFLADKARVNPQVLRPLWEVAKNLEPDISCDPISRLRTYLTGLWIAAGSRPHDELLDAAQGALTTHDLHRAFHGPGVPDWSVHEQLAIVLYSLPDALEPLWQSAHADPRACQSTLPAEPFG
ncbi:helix-turn-helix domain-containing protein [Streptomyces sp. NPDC002248]